MSRARYFDTSDVYIYFHDFIIMLEIGEENFQKKILSLLFSDSNFYQTFSENNQIMMFPLHSLQNGFLDNLHANSKLHLPL